MTVLEDFKPIQTNILGLMRGYLNHRHDVLIRIHKERKQKAETRLHIVEGLIIASEDIDSVIALIKASENRGAARTALIEKYKLSAEQSNAILDMRLARLTKIDSLDLLTEQTNLINSIKKYIEIIDNKNKRNEIIKYDLDQINKNFGDARRTLLKNTQNEEIERPEIHYAIGLHENNEISVVEIDNISAGARNRVGKKVFDSVPKQVIQFNSKNSLLVFDQEGKVTEIDGSRIEEGHHLLYDIDSRVKENVVFMLEIAEEDKAKEFLVTITKGNLIKKTLLSEYNNFRTTIFAAKLRKKDQIVYAGLANDDEYVLILTESNINKYKLSEIRATGRATQGVRASGHDTILAATIGAGKDKIALVDSDSSGKSFLVDDVTGSSRTTKGMPISEKSRDLLKMRRGNVVLIGSDNRGYIMDAAQIESKNPKNMNNKLYNGKLLKLGF